MASLFGLFSSKKVIPAVGDAKKAVTETAEDKKKKAEKKEALLNALLLDKLQKKREEEKDGEARTRQMSTQITVLEQAQKDVLRVKGDLDKKKDAMRKNKSAQGKLEEAYKLQEIEVLALQGRLKFYEEEVVKYSMPVEAVPAMEVAESYQVTDSQYELSDD